MLTSIYNLLEILSIMICLSFLYDKKFKFDITTVAIISADLILMQFVIYYNLPRECTLLFYPILIIYCFIEYGFKIKSVIVNMLLVIGIMAILQYIVMYIGMQVMRLTFIEEKDMLIFNIIIFILVFFVLRFCRLNKISSYLQDKGRLLIISIGFCFVIIMMNLLSNKGNKEIELTTTAIILTSATLICALAAGLGKYHARAVEVETELRINKMYEESYKALIDSIRMKQHEFENHINSIYSQHLIYHTYEDLIATQKKYCQELQQENHFNKLLSNGNSTIIGFLYGKFLEISEKDVDIAYRVNIKDFACDVPSYKIIECLSDLMNNAAEFLEQSEEYNKLYVSIIETENVINIEIRNESTMFSIDEIQYFFTKGFSKKGEGRGLGLYNVKTICSHYNLDLKCENKEIENQNWISFQIDIKKKLPK